MPIRFRCGHCNQLLGIARRKAGTRVRCPTCAAEVLVPTNESDPESPEPSPPPAPPPTPAAEEVMPRPVFERSDFEEAFRAPAPLPSRPVPLPAPPVSHPADELDEVNVERVPLPPDLLEAVQRKPGIWLSPALATLLSVLAVVALALAFAGGLVVGLMFRAPE